MKITKPIIIKDAYSVRLVSEVIFNNGKRNVLYIKTKKAYLKYLQTDSSPFLAAVLFMALKIGEDIVIEGTISKALFKNTQSIMDLLLSWNKGFKRITITADGFTKDEKKGSKTGLFFSGGVDSFYTFLKHKASLSHLFFLQGMDIRLHEKKLYKQIYAHLEQIALQEGVTLIPVQTNIRYVVDKHVSWTFGHGSVLMSVALAFSKEISTMFVSGGMYIKSLRPAGTHPYLDHLWSTEAQTIKHFGQQVDRLAKITFLTKFPKALERLRVCWVNKDNMYNCGRCEKCLRTMLSLYTAGALEKSKTFPQSIDPRFIERLYIDEKNHYRYFRENLVALQKAKKAPELVNALERCLHNNENPKTIVRAYRSTRHVFSEFDAKFLNSSIFLLMQKRYGKGAIKA